MGAELRVGNKTNFLSISNLAVSTSFSVLNSKRRANRSLSCAAGSHLISIRRAELMVRVGHKDSISLGIAEH